MVHLRQLHETYGDQVQFLFVNIWDPGHKLPDEVQQVLSDTQIPLDLQREPSHCARAGMAGFHLNFPCLLDTEDYEVMKLYRAFPQRMLLLDAAGRIVVDSGLGPWQPFLWQQISDWLKSHPVP